MNREQKLVLAWSLAWEGSISLVSNKDRTCRNSFALRPQISIFNTDKELLEQFRDYIGYGYVGLQTHRYNENRGWKDCYVWRPHGQKEHYEILKETIPFLPAKKRQGELLLEFLEIRKKKRPYRIREHQIHNEIRKLNIRGKGRGKH